MLTTFEFIKAVSDTVLDIINTAYHDKPWILSGYGSREARLHSSGSEWNRFLSYAECRIKTTSTKESHFIFDLNGRLAIATKLRAQYNKKNSKSPRQDHFYMHMYIMWVPKTLNRPFISDFTCQRWTLFSDFYKNNVQYVADIRIQLL